MRRFLLVVAMCCFALPAFAEGADANQNADAESAKALLKDYLDATVKAAQGKKPKSAEVSKKLTVVKKYIHPKTLELIAQQEKRQVVTNALAVWHWAKNDYWLTEYEIREVNPAVNGTFVAEVSERNWRVEEGGTDGEMEPTSYLIGKHKGKWILFDKRRNTSFTKDAIIIGYKDYFEGLPPEPAKEKDAEAAE